MTINDILNTDIFDVLCKIPYKQSKEDAAVEAALLEYYDRICVDDVSLEAINMIMQDVYVGDVIEKVQGKAISAYAIAKRVGSSMGAFVRTMQRITMSHIATEKFIRKRFDGLKTKYVTFFYKELADRHAYVIAPSYDTMSKRLIGLHNCVTFLKRAAESTNPSDTVNTDTYAKLVNISNGALTVKGSDMGLVNHLVWNPPKLEQYYLVGSPFQKIENIDNLCNSVLFVKYKTMEGVDVIVKECLKRTKRLNDQAEDMVSYDVDDEHAEQYMHDYGSAYMLSKMLKDIVKQGIQREVNTLVINYIHKLKAIKKEDK